LVSVSTTAAFEEILAHDLTRLYRVAFRLLRNHEDAEDALQEALWKAFLKLPSFRGGSSLSTWVTRIVINSALMVLRSRKSHREFSLDEMLESQPEVLASRAADSRPGPEQMCGFAELARTMENQFLMLSDGERTAFRHFVIDGHSARQSAEACGVPAGTFKSRILRTRRKLARGIERSTRRPSCFTPHLGDAVHDAELQ
jgi:RNA polymerase sigma-70 factor (ECF subfamily)